MDSVFILLMFAPFGTLIACRGAKGTRVCSVVRAMQAYVSQYSEHATDAGVVGIADEF